MNCADWGRDSRRWGATMNSFIANAAGFTFTADVFGPLPSTGAQLTFPVGAGSEPVAAPEPGTLALLGLGLMGLALTRTRKTA
jgi:hypothetical protein